MPRLQPPALSRRAFATLALCAPFIARAARAEEPIVVGGGGSTLALFRLVATEAQRSGRIAVLPTVLPSLGSAAALAAIAAGKLDLALAYRAVTDAEAASGLVSACYAATPVVFASQASNPERSVDLDGIAAILTGERRRWADGTPIRCVRRPAYEGGDVGIVLAQSPILAAAHRALMDRPGLPTAGTDTENAELIEGRAGTFGTASMGQLAAERRRTVALSLGKLEPGVDALREGAWPWVKRFHVVRSAEPRPQARALFDFLTGGDAAALLIEHAHLPQVAGRG